MYSVVFHVILATSKYNKPSFYVVVLITFRILDMGDVSHHLVFSDIGETVQGDMCIISGSCRSHNHSEVCILCNWFGLKDVPQT